MKKIFGCPALELIHCLLPLFHCLPLWKTVRLHGKKLQNATNKYVNGIQKVSQQNFGDMKTFDVTIDHILVHFIGSKLELYVSFRIPL